MTIHRDQTPSRGRIVIDRVDRGGCSVAAIWHLHLCRVRGVAVGMRVLVPFRGRQSTGFVLGPATHPPPKARIKPVSAVLDTTPLFPSALSDFLHWVADYYIHPIGEVIHTALPGGLMVREQPVFYLFGNSFQGLVWVISLTCSVSIYI